MKNILCVMLFSSVSIFASSTKQYENKRSYGTKKIKVALTGKRTRCQIVGDLTYKYCKEHGYSEISASAIANAAEKECNRVATKETTTITQ